MKRISKLYVILGTVVVLMTAVLATNSYRICLMLGFAELFRPVRVISVPLPQTCVPLRVEPSGAAMAIVSSQAERFRLKLEAVSICRMPEPQPQSEREFAFKFFNQTVREHWLEVYGGCCTYSYRRNFAVVIVQNSEDGAIVVSASLVQDRWAYLRFLRQHCDEKLKAWL
jgi:hypothetical protein